jgi:hypothetical protein
MQHFVRLIKVFRLIAWLIFIAGLILCLKSAFDVIFRGVPLYFGGEGVGLGTEITDPKVKILVEVGFLAGWILVFTLILRFTSITSGRETQLGDVLLLNEADKGRWGSGLGSLVVAVAIAGFIYVAILERRLLAWTTILLVLGECLTLYMTAYVLFKVNRIRLDFSTRSYQQDLGFLWNPKRSTGSFDDFQCVRLAVEEHSTSEDGSYKTWDISLWWKDSKREPLQIDRRPRGFHDLKKPPALTSREQARELADKMRIPLRDETEPQVST